MVAQVMMYRANSGKMFETEHEAERDDFRTWLIDSVNGDVEAMAIVATGICCTREMTDATIDMLNRINATRPPMTTAAPPAIAASAPLPPAPSAGYPVPDLDRSRARCMGGRECTHTPGYCTADRDFQRWIKAVELWRADDPSRFNTNFKVAAPAVQQEWLHKAEYTK